MKAPAKKKRIIARKPRAPGAAPVGGELPPASSEALAIDQAAAASAAQIDGAAAPGPEQAPDLGAALNQEQTQRALEVSAQERAQVEARGTAQVLLTLAAKVCEKRFLGVSFDAGEIDQGAAVLAPVLIKYDLGSGLLERWKEEFAAGAFFVGVWAAKREQYERAQAEREAAAKEAAQRSAEAGNGG